MGWSVRQKGEMSMTRSYTCDCSFFSFVFSFDFSDFSGCDKLLSKSSSSGSFVFEGADGRESNVVIFRDNAYVILSRKYAWPCHAIP